MALSLKIASCAGIILFLIHANPAFAHDPRDVGEQSAACVAAGGQFSVGDNRYEYDCDYDDGSSQVCDFSDPTSVDCETDFAEADIDPVDVSDFHKKH